MEFPFIPDTQGIPLVADMSSNIMSGPLDVSKVECPCFKLAGDLCEKIRMLSRNFCLLKGNNVNEGLIMDA